MIHVVSGTSPQFQTLGTHSKSDWINANTPPYGGPPTYAPGDVIPDGQGGVLADWTNQEPDGPPLTLADISANGVVQADFENLYGDWENDRPIDGDLVLGDNNTAFVTDGYSVTSFSPVDLSQYWSYGTTGGTLSFVVANPGSAVTINDSQEGIIALDSYGNAGTPTLSLEGASYFGNELWMNITGDPGVSAVYGTMLDWVGGFAAPSGDGEAQRASREDVSLVWCTNGLCKGSYEGGRQMQDVPFTIRAVDLPHNTFSFGRSQITLMQQSAATAFQTAFAPYNVAVVTNGRQGAHTVWVVGEVNENLCGATPPGIINLSAAYYSTHAEYAQDAASDTAGTPTPALARAVGTGIGNTAAHETAHQLATEHSNLIVNLMGLDDQSNNTYNSEACSYSSPWVFGFGPIKWGSSADQSLANIFGRKQ